MKFGHEWQLWELRLTGFALPWWLAWAPSLIGWVWRLLNGAVLPREASNWMGVSYVLLLVGIVLSLAALSSDVAAMKETENVRVLAAMFLLGVCTLPVALFFV